MASNEVNTTNIEVPLQVTMKDPKKVEAGERLAEYNHKKNEELAEAQKSEPKLTSSQYWGCHSCRDVRHSWSLCLLIRERRCDFSSPIQERRHDSSSIFGTSN